MNAWVALTAVVLSSAPGGLDFAVAERTGAKSARLTILRSDERLQALCLDLEGWSTEMIEQAQEQVTARPVWLYLGSRKIARGRLDRFESTGSPTAPCAVTAEAHFEDFIPIIAKSEILWATTRDLGSQPRKPSPLGTIERARLALPNHSSCAAPSAAVARPVASGSFVDLTCPDRAPSLLFVPKAGEPRIVDIDSPDGAATLLEALDTALPGQTTLFLAREVEGGRRIEVWESDGLGARRVDAWAY